MTAPGWPDANTLITAAYGLAIRITGDGGRAAAALETVGRPGAPVGYLNAVRRSARAQRHPVRDDVPAAAPPERLGDLVVADWEVVERVALRGLSLTEVAQVLEI